MRETKVAAQQEEGRMATSRSVRRLWWLVTMVLAALALTVVAIRQGSRGGEDTATIIPKYVTAPVPDVSSGTAGSAGTPSRPLPAGASGSIDQPPGGTTVQGCVVLRGTVSRPAGMIVITAMHNLDNGDPAWYGEKVFTQPAPATSGAWAGPQYFGSENTSVGQHYEVVLALMDDAVRITDDMGADAIGRLARTGHRLASATYERVAGVPADQCASP